MFNPIQSILPIKNQKKTKPGKGNSLSRHVLKPVFVREDNIMRKTSLLVLAIIILSLVFLNGKFSVWATIYRIIDTEGNTIRVTTEPQMKKSEEETGCIFSPIQPDIVPPVSKDISQDYVET